MAALCDKINRLRFPITIEPLVLLYTVSVGLNEVIRSNLIISKICLSKLNYNSTICDNLSEDNNTQYQDEVQKHVTDYESVYSSLAFIPRILYGLLAGTWSDKHGRKPLLVLPMVGQLCASLSYAFNYFFLESLPWQLISLEFLNELAGTYVVYYMAEYTYIADITTEDSRTFRLSIVDGMDYVSTSVGTYISGLLFLYGGYYAVFGSSAICCILTLVILAVWVKESLPKPGKQGDDDKLNTDTGPNYGSTKDLSETNGKTDNTTDQPSTLAQKNPREFPRKPILFLSIFSFACFIFTYNGTEGTHRYMYAQKKYGWNEQNFTQYLFHYRIAYMITLWIISPVLTRLLNVPDPVINIVACAVSSVGYILPAVMANAKWFTIGSFICMFFPLTTITARSMLSRVVPAEEMGRIFSVLALFSATSGSLVEAVFQKVYAASIDKFLGAYLLLNAGLVCATIPCSLAILALNKKLDK
uniref:Proton-coupled folate transporter-like protein n=1 Tax=Acartia pacifica TaxID=335913 RepID=A0A0U2KD20_ACAPC|nr:proton-coupled folate transporter-like protein [Acartia pacifica]